MIAELAAAVMAPVHTTGINWESVITIAISVSGSVAGAAKYVTSRVEKSRHAAQEQSQRFVGEQVGQVAKLLNMKLEQIRGTLEQQDRSQRVMVSQIADVRDRTARIEGELRRR